MRYSALLFILSIVLPSFSLSEPDLWTFLEEDGAAPPFLTISRDLLSQNKKAVETLLKSTSGVVLFLPTDRAWQDDDDILGYLEEKGDHQDKLREDILEALAGDVGGNTTWAGILKLSEKQNGRIDTFYGTKLFLEKRGRVCVAEYTGSGQYEKGECGKIRFPGIALSDGHVYPVEDVILPDHLFTEIELAAGLDVDEDDDEDTKS